MKSNDQCRVGSWVFATIKATGTIGDGPTANLPEAGLTICGQIVEQLAPTEHAVKGIVVVKVYQMLETRHPIFGMPRLIKATADGESLIVVPAEVWPSCFLPLEVLTPP